MTKNEIASLLRRSDEQISKALAIPLTEDEKVRMDRYLCVKRKGCIEMARKHYTKDFINEVVKTYAESDLTNREICEGYGISSTTLYKWTNRLGISHKNRNANDIKAGRKQEETYPLFTRRFNELIFDQTLEQVAKKIGLSRATVGHYSAGIRVPNALVVKKIAETCGVTSDWLLGLSNGEIKTCNCCEKTVVIEKGVKYCPWCGTVIRSEKELMVERFEDVAKLSKFIPEANRGEFLSVVNDAAKFLGEK